MELVLPATHFYFRFFTITLRYQIDCPPETRHVCQAANFQQLANSCEVTTRLSQRDELPYFPNCTRELFVVVN